MTKTRPIPTPITTTLFADNALHHHPTPTPSPSNSDSNGLQRLVNDLLYATFGRPEDHNDQATIMKKKKNKRRAVATMQSVNAFSEKGPFDAYDVLLPKPWKESTAAAVAPQEEEADVLAADQIQQEPTTNEFQRAIDDLLYASFGQQEQHKLQKRSIVQAPPMGAFRDKGPFDAYHVLEPKPWKPSSSSSSETQDEATATAMPTASSPSSEAPVKKMSSKDFEIAKDELQRVVDDLLYASFGQQHEDGDEEAKKRKRAARIPMGAFRDEGPYDVYDALPPKPWKPEQPKP